MTEILSSGNSVPGFDLLRTLSERERTSVYLARDSAGTYCALKVVKPAPGSRGGNAAQNLQLIRRLQELSVRPGLLPILDCGVTVEGLVWKKLPLADPLPGLPGPDQEQGIEQYTPLTLRARTQEQGPAAAQTVIQWGQRLADGLEALHKAGLVHRDVKPDNILFISGEPCLGDYGLVAEAGPGLEFLGTEGYRPLEGTNGCGADLFALGKTLYEAWTGRDRLEYPSLTRLLLSAPDWPVYGSTLNEIILRTCHNNPTQRYASAAELKAALGQALSGSKPPRRNRAWALIGGLMLVVGVVWVGYFLVQPKSRLINIDFGAGQATRKEGPAVLGVSPKDFWNFYTRDEPDGGYKTFEHLANLRSADGAPTEAALTIVNAPGAWPIASPDPMFNHVVYALDRRSVLLTVTNLVPGYYEILCYSHDGCFEMEVGDVKYGTRRCYDPNDVQQLVWTEGVHYARFQNVAVRPGQELVLTVRTGLTHWAKIAGLQISGPHSKSKTR